MKEDSLRAGAKLLMGEDDAPTEVVEHLEQALEAEEANEKDFHVRQALQILEVDGGDS